MKQILCFGDSNTWGLIPKTNQRYPWGVRWTSILDNELNRHFNNEYRVIEEGLCGRTTVFDDPLRDGRNSFKLLPTILESHNPVTDVIIMLGTNDCKTVYNASAEVIGQGVERLINQVKRFGQYYIQMWHGSFGIKKIEKNCDCLTNSQSWTYLAKKNSQNTDFWISNSFFEDEVYQNAFWSVKNILKLGHPRNDIFFKDGQDLVEKKVRKSLSIDGKDKILLYVPTFREKLDFPNYKLDIEKLKKALEKKTDQSWKIVVRLHPRMQNSLEKVCIDEKKQIVKADAYPDIQELLAAAQVVITDYSSCIFDFLLTVRPGFLFVPDLEHYDQERGFYYKLEETPFPIAHTNEELIHNIENFNQEKYSMQVEDFLKKKGSVEDGEASVRVCNLIESIVSEKEIRG